MGYTKAQALEFIEMAAPIIQAEAKKRGYAVCSTTIAQAIIEGACGTSGLARPPYNNHFGLKCGKSWTGRSVNFKTKEEYVAGSPVTIKDNFRCYDSFADCVAGYYQFINTSRYANLKTAATYKEFAERLKADGYATASNYVNTLCSTVERYSLDKYDMDNVTVPAQPHPILRKGSRGEEVKKLQSALTHNGFVTTSDGIFGPATEQNVISFQGMKGLTKDGIVGPQTWKALNV